MPAPAAASSKTPWKSAAAPISSGAAAPAFTTSEFPSLAPAALRPAHAVHSESATSGKRAQQQQQQRASQAKAGKQNSTAAAGPELENDLNAWCQHELSILGIDTIDCTNYSVCL